MVGKNKTMEEYKEEQNKASNIILIGLLVFLFGLTLGAALGYQVGNEMALNIIRCLKVGVC